MAVGKSENYEEAIQEAVDKSFSKTAKVIQLNVGKEQLGVVVAIVNVRDRGKTTQRVKASQDGNHWVAKTV